MKKLKYILNSILYALYGSFILITLIQDQTKFYITPKIEPFLILLFVLLFALLIFEVSRIFNKNKTAIEASCNCHVHKNEKTLPVNFFITYIIFALPLVLGFSLPSATLDSSIAEKRTLPKVEDQPKNNAITEKNIESNKSDRETLVLTDETYLDEIMEITNNIEGHEEQSIKLLGFVFHNDDFEEDKKFVLRYGITCCIADAFPYGVLAVGEEMMNLNNDTWVEITGSLGGELVAGYEQPVLFVEEVKEVEQPEDPYVYLDGFKIGSSE